MSTELFSWFQLPSTYKARIEELERELAEKAEKESRLREQRLRKEWEDSRPKLTKAVFYFKTSSPPLVAELNKEVIELRLQEGGQNCILNQQKKGQLIVTTLNTADITKIVKVYATSDKPDQWKVCHPN